MTDLIRTPEEYRQALRVLDDASMRRTAPAGLEPLVDQIIEAVKRYEARTMAPSRRGWPEAVAMLERLAG
ncbi:MAG TPA: hypothetical protein VED40_12600 [Azospirillaceae bacterium]|nr:hypothetical protein [Azospirillaceae bacterium]